MVWPDKNSRFYDGFVITSLSLSRMETENNQPTKPVLQKKTGVKSLMFSSDPSKFSLKISFHQQTHVVALHKDEEWMKFQKIRFDLKFS